MIMLLSPAKTLDLSATAIKLCSTPPFESQATELVGELAKLSKAQLKALLGTSDSITKLNFDRYQGFAKQQTKQAILSFDGPAFKGLSAANFDKKQQAFAQEHLRVLCGLYGILRPFDAIRPYRLDMGKKLVTAEANNLYGYWVS